MCAGVEEAVRTSERSLQDRTSTLSQEWELYYRKNIASRINSIAAPTKAPGGSPNNTASDSAVSVSNVEAAAEGLLHFWTPTGTKAIFLRTLELPAARGIQAQVLRERFEQEGDIRVQSNVYSKAGISSREYTSELREGCSLIAIAALLLLLLLPALLLLLLLLSHCCSWLSAAACPLTAAACWLAACPLTAAFACSLIAAVSRLWRVAENNHWISNLSALPRSCCCSQTSRCRNASKDANSCAQAAGSSSCRRSIPSMPCC